MTAPNPPEKKPPNPFFPTVLFASAIFVITIFGMVAALLGDPEGPLAKFMDEHGSRLMIAEVVAILLVGFLALLVDRIQTLRQKSRENSHSQETS